MTALKVLRLPRSLPTTTSSSSGTSCMETCGMYVDHSDCRRLPMYLGPKRIHVFNSLQDPLRYWTKRIPGSSIITKVEHCLSSDSRSITHRLIPSPVCWGNGRMYPAIAGNPSLHLFRHHLKKKKKGVRASCSIAHLGKPNLTAFCLSCFLFLTYLLA